jgi:hypothetical protein
MIFRGYSKNLEIRKNAEYRWYSCLDGLMTSKYDIPSCYGTKCVGISSRIPFVEDSLNRVMRLWNIRTKKNFPFDFEIIQSYADKSGDTITFIHDRSGLFDNNRAVDHVFLSYLRSLHEKRGLSSGGYVGDTFKSFLELLPFLRQPCCGIITIPLRRNSYLTKDSRFSGFYDLRRLIGELSSAGYPKEIIIKNMVGRNDSLAYNLKLF